MIYFFIKKFTKIKPSSFFIHSYLGGFFIAGLSILINIIIDTSTHTLIHQNYKAVYGNTVEIINGANYVDEETIQHNTFVFKYDDKNYVVELDRLEKKYGKSSYNSYILWQTAFARGFEPKNISSFTVPKTFFDKAILSFLIGPLFILEILINSIFNSLVIMVIPIIALFFKIRLFGNII